MIFRPWRKTAVGSIRDNNAAWVAGPSRICFVRLASDSPERSTAAGRCKSKTKTRFDSVRWGPVPAKAHPDFRDRPGPVLVPASVSVPAREKVVAGVVDRSVRADTAPALYPSLKPTWLWLS